MSAAAVQPGITVLLTDSLSLIRGKRIALLTNQTGIARGFSRNPGVDKLLPYVAPTTDWIRLQRRIPVTIVLEDLPPGYKLYMGADARTVIFPRSWP